MLNGWTTSETGSQETSAQGISPSADAMPNGTATASPSPERHFRTEPPPPPILPADGHLEKRPELKAGLAYRGQVRSVAVAEPPHLGDVARTLDLQTGWLAVDRTGCAWISLLGGKTYLLAGTQGSRVENGRVVLIGFGTGQELRFGPGDLVSGEGIAVDVAAGAELDPMCADTTIPARAFLVRPFPTK